MLEYHRILKSILANGEWKGNRTGVRCLTTFCETFRHNMSDGFPLLTTKKMAYKSMLVELEGFIKGITSKKWYQDRICKIWNEWANPLAVNKRQIKWQEENCKRYDDFKDCVVESDKLRKQFQLEEDDLGPIYGYQWRKFGGEYHFNCNEYPVDYEVTDFPNGLPYWKDQLSDIVTTLKRNPDDRRMICLAWNPNQLHMQALPACHYAWTLVHINGTLNLSWKQRSCDTLLGVPFNIASYATLLLLLCKESNLKPGVLFGLLEDCHIYENHMEQVKEQLTREPYPLPTVEIPDVLKSSKPFSIFDWTYEDFVLKDYVCHPPIKAEVAV